MQSLCEEAFRPRAERLLAAQLFGFAYLRGVFGGTGNGFAPCGRIF